jgi:hypothetical protein
MPKQFVMNIQKRQTSTIHLTRCFVAKQQQLVAKIQQTGKACCDSSIPLRSSVAFSQQSVVDGLPCISAVPADRCSRGSQKAFCTSYSIGKDGKICSSSNGSLLSPSISLYAYVNSPFFKRRKPLFL